MTPDERDDDYEDDYDGPPEAEDGALDEKGLDGDDGPDFDAETYADGDDDDLDEEAEAGPPAEVPMSEVAGLEDAAVGEDADPALTADARAQDAMAQATESVEDPLDEPLPGPGDLESAEGPDAAGEGEEQPDAEAGEAQAAEGDAGGEADEAAAAVAVPGEEPPAEDVPNNKKWYVVKVQSGRENTIRNAIVRRMKRDNLEEFFGEILIPKEKVTVDRKVTVRKKNKEGETVTSQQTRRVVREQTKFPGYLFVEVEFNDDVLYLFRETSGVGDFVGHNRLPTPMSDGEVNKLLMDAGLIEPDDPLANLGFAVGDKVKINDGAFADMIGDVKEIMPPKEKTDPVRVRLEVTIWDRPVPVELESWQVEQA